MGSVRWASIGSGTPALLADGNLDLAPSLKSILISGNLTRFSTFCEVQVAYDGLGTARRVLQKTWCPQAFCALAGGYHSYSRSPVIFATRRRSTGGAK